MFGMGTRSQVAVVGPPELMELPLWREVLSGWELVRLKASRVYYGCGVERGDKSAVVVVPGFLGADLYLLEMYGWLWRMGYTPYFSRIGHNAQCPDVLLHRLIKTVNQAYKDTGRPVHLIGHSFGGVLSRAVGRRHPDRVASIITLGSPFRGTRVNPWIMSAIKRVRQAQYWRGRKGKDCFTESCACGFLCTMRDGFPVSVRHTNVYTKTDGVVDWNVCREENEAVDVEVKGTHVGLVWNPEVYRIVAERLVHPVPVPKELQPEATSEPRLKAAPAKKKAVAKGVAKAAAKAAPKKSVASPATVAKAAVKRAKPAKKKPTTTKAAAAETKAKPRTRRKTTPVV